jgi:hypothetical protein
MAKQSNAIGDVNRLHRSRKFTRIRGWALAGVLLLSACQFPVPGPAPTPTADLDTVRTQEGIITQAAETIAAQLQETSTQGAAQAPTEVTPAPSPTPVFTPTQPPTPTSTPLSAATATPTAIAATPTAAATTAALPLLQAEFATNCRLGPGTSYDIVAVLPTGVKVEVYGRDRSSVWWYIRNPEDSQSFCWVWSGTTLVEGDTSNVEVRTASSPAAATQPAGAGTQTAATQPAGSATQEAAVFFRIASVNIRNCGSPRMIFGIRNRSGQTFESVRILIEDLEEERALYGPASEDAPFLRSDRDCGSGASSLGSGGLGFVGAWLERTASSGSLIRVTMRFCTSDDLEGSCFDRVIEFIWP